MTKRFIQDNRGQVLYAVIITIMFVGLLSMIAMGLTLKNYQAAQVKQQHVKDYYAADAVAELIRVGKIEVGEDSVVLIDATTFKPAEDGTIVVTKVVPQAEGEAYKIQTDTATLTMSIENGQFKSWEVSYHAVQTEAEDEQPSN